MSTPHKQARRLTPPEGKSILSGRKPEKGDIMSCDIEQHKMHMCELRAGGAEDCILSLSENPAFTCQNCGAKADKAENLCAPEPIPVM